ncbi:SpoIIIAH-like family protein [Caenibacillus caldisaponilyticus]|uniref:SpoIIIAH-like family protein n=1 Tax=Caenibacillus caldisaponilyticus TaxID=1674942 RepID=UPI0013011BCB|nr:SpoIIIAH-like family protein [Caenibacillus caldisaponilyticus]
MVLKKQTVWLLTMLSLIVVLSVYYVTSPGGAPADQAGLLTNNKDEKSSAKKENGLTSTVAPEDRFAEYRLQRDESRHDLEKKLQAEMTDKGSDAQAVSKAYDQIQAINALANKEKILEDMIMSKGYEDAVVAASETSSDVNVYVKADSLSNKQVNEIIAMVYKELGTDNVRVTYEKSKG